MTTAIIGLGNMGKGLASRLAGKTDLILASHEPDASLSAALGARAMTVDAAIGAAGVVILTLPYASALEIAGHPGPAGKIVVDISNPVKPDFSGLILGHTTSAAEEIQARAKGAYVVKAWNTIFAQLFARPRRKPQALRSIWPAKSGHWKRSPISCAGRDLRSRRSARSTRRG